MSKVIVHGGDFQKGNHSFSFGTLHLGDQHRDIRGLSSIEVASEQNVKKMTGSVGLGLVGYALLGPFGGIAGMLAGGNKKDVTFIATFQDGGKLLATTDRDTYIKLQAAVFDRDLPPQPDFAHKVLERQKKDLAIIATKHPDWTKEQVKAQLNHNAMIKLTVILLLLIGFIICVSVLKSPEERATASRNDWIARHDQCLNTPTDDSAALRSYCDRTVEWKQTPMF